MAEKYIHSGDTVWDRYKEDDYPNIMSWPAWARKDLMKDWRQANPGRDEDVIQAGETLNFPTSNYPQQLGLRGGIGGEGRLSVDDILRITSYNSRRRSGLTSGVNAIRAAMGQSGSFSLPTGGVSASYLQTVMGLKDKEVLNRIIDMQSQADLETDAEYRKWYSDWGLDPRFFADSRDAWNKQKRSREQTIRSQEMTVEHEAKVEDRAVKRGYDALEAARVTAYGQASQEIIPKSGNVYVPGAYDPMPALNRMLARLAAIGTKDEDIRNLEASLRAKIEIYKKNVNGTMDDSLTRISNDIIDRLASGELTSSRAIAEYSNRAKGFPTKERNAGANIIKEVISNIKHEKGEQKRQAELDISLEKVRKIEADPDKAKAAIRIIDNITARVREGTLPWGEADAAFKDAMLAKARNRTTDSTKLNQWSTYLANEIKDLAPPKKQEQVIRLNRWVDLATRGDKSADKYLEDLSTLSAQIRDKMTGVGGITIGFEAKDYAATFGREVLSVVMRLPPNQRLGVWNWFEAQSTDRISMIEGATGRKPSDTAGNIWSMAEYLKKASAVPLPGSTEVVEAIAPAGFTHIKSITKGDGSIVEIGLDIPNNTDPKMSSGDRWGQLLEMGLKDYQAVAIMLDEGYE